MVNSKDYQIGALWMEGRLSFLEQLCLKSFVDAGHHVILYHYGPLLGVPDGIELRDANMVLPRTNFLKHERTGSPALHSDLFRYKMLEQNDGMIWADTDAYCVKKFETPNGHFYGWESDKHINGGVLGLPKDSDTLRELLDYTKDEFAIPSWYGPEYERELEEKKQQERQCMPANNHGACGAPMRLRIFCIKPARQNTLCRLKGSIRFRTKIGVKC